MTNDELDDARAKEAWGQVGLSAWDKHNRYARAAIFAAALSRENWQPTDPDLVLARGVCAEFATTQHSNPDLQEMYREGKCDNRESVQIALAAIRAAREGQS